MPNLIRRVIVIARAAPTWLAAAALIAPIVAEEAATVLPGPWSERVTALALTVTAVATATISVIRRVSPVSQHERGLLTPGGNVDVAERLAPYAQGGVIPGE